MQNKNFKKETFAEGLYRKLLVKYNDIVDTISEKRGNIYESVGQCPKCKKDVLHLDNHYYCLGILSDKCNFRVPDTFKGNKISYDDILNAIKQKVMYDEGFFEHLSLNNSTNECGNGEIKRNTTNNTFDSSTSTKVINKDTSNKKEVNKKELLSFCPICSGAIEVRKNTYNCTKCNFKLDKFFHKTKIEPNEIKLLLSKGETSELEFKDKNGENFKSKLSLNNNKCNYVFSSNKKDIKDNENVIYNDTVEDISNEFYEEDINYNYENYEENINYNYEEMYYNDCQEQSYNKAAIAICPKCKKNIIAGKNAFGCIGNKDKTCNFIVPFTYNGLFISKKDIQDLVIGKTISIIDSNNIEIYLKLDKNLELEQVLF